MTKAGSGARYNEQYEKYKNGQYIDYNNEERIDKYIKEELEQEYNNLRPKNLGVKFRDCSYDCRDNSVSRSSNKNSHDRYITNVKTLGSARKITGSRQLTNSIKNVQFEEESLNMDSIYIENNQILDSSSSVIKNDSNAPIFDKNPNFLNNNKYTKLCKKLVEKQKNKSSNKRFEDVVSQDQRNTLSVFLKNEWESRT